MKYEIIKAYGSYGIAKTLKNKIESEDRNARISVFLDITETPFVTSNGNQYLVVREITDDND